MGALKVDVFGGVGNVQLEHSELSQFMNTRGAHLAARFSKGGASASRRT